MVIRIVLAAFVSTVFGVCFLAGLTRLMSALLIGFGAASALFFGIVFLLPPGDERLGFVVYGSTSPWPFFTLSACLIIFIAWLLLQPSRPAEPEQFGPTHLKKLGLALLLYMASLFIPILFWSPSEEAVRAAAAASLEIRVLAGVCIYLVGSSGALFLLYRASLGTTSKHPDLMRRFILALFSVFHLDKVPALVAYLLVFSADAAFVFPKLAALGLAAYIPVALFLAKTSLACRLKP